MKYWLKTFLQSAEMTFLPRNGVWLQLCELFGRKELGEGLPEVAVRFVARLPNDVIHRGGWVGARYDYDPVDSDIVDMVDPTDLLDLLRRLSPRLSQTSASETCVLKAVLIVPGQPSPDDGY